MGIARTAPRAARLPAAQAGPAIKPAAKPAAKPVKAKADIQQGYDRLIDAMNRLPRPALMLVTVALFAFAAVDPVGFGARMQALAEVPEPLWWMQGAIVTFYFGAREAHYSRQGRKPAPPAPKSGSGPQSP